MTSEGHSVSAGSRVVETLRKVCAMQDEATAIARKQSSRLEEAAPIVSKEPGPAPWPATPTPSEKEEELRKAQETNIWDWRLKGRFREKPKTKETRKAMFMYKKHREAVSNLGIFKIDQKISAYEDILQEGIDTRNKRTMGIDVPPLPLRPASAAVSSHTHPSAQAHAPTAKQTHHDLSKPKSTLPVRPASAAAFHGSPSHSHAPPSRSDAEKTRKKISPAESTRPASAAQASQSSHVSSGAAERAKSAMPWMRHSSHTTTDGKHGDEETFLTACKEESTEFESARKSGNRQLEALAEALDHSQPATGAANVGESAGPGWANLKDNPKPGPNSAVSGKLKTRKGWQEVTVDEAKARGTGRGERAATVPHQQLENAAQHKPLLGPGSAADTEHVAAQEAGPAGAGRLQTEAHVTDFEMELAETMKPPELRADPPAAPRSIADYLPTPKPVTPKTEYMHGKEYLQGLRNDLEKRVTALEQLYEHDEATPRTLEAIIQRKNGLSSGWTRESLAGLDDGRRAKEAAATSMAEIDARTTSFKDVLTVMTEEWLRVDDLMDHVDLLMKSFDAMTDGHLLLSGNALPARIEDDGGYSPPLKTHPQGTPHKRHLHDEGGGDEPDGGSTNRSRGSTGSPSRFATPPGGIGMEGAVSAMSGGAGGVPPLTPGLSRQTTSLTRQGTMARQASSKFVATPSPYKPGRLGGNAALNAERQRALAVQDWLDSAGVDGAKVYNAAVVDRAFMGDPDAARREKVSETAWETKGRSVSIQDRGEEEEEEDEIPRDNEEEEEEDVEGARDGEGGAMGAEEEEEEEEEEVVKGEEDVGRSELRWHHGMAAVRNVIKSGSVKVRFHSRGTQIPVVNEIERTLSHQLKGQPKFIHDFAVRELRFPHEWEAFLAGLTPEQLKPKLMTTSELSETILDIYFSKLLHENKEATLQEFKMSMPEYVCFHLLERTGDMDEAKELLRDLAYSVAEQHAKSNKFKLFARFCGILQAVPDVILDFYLLFMLECKPYIVKPLKEGSALHKLVGQGRDFIMAQFKTNVVEKAFHQSVSSARQLAIKSKMNKIPIHRQVDDGGQKMDLCDVDDMWLNVSEEFEQQFEQGRVEAGSLLLAADMNQDGTVDLEEFMEIIRLFDPSFSKAQVAKMFFDALAESGSDCITQKAFLTIGDKYKLFQTRGMKMLDLAQRDVSALNAQSLQMLRTALSIEDDKIVQRINIFTNAEKEQEAQGKEILHAYQDLKQSVEDAYTLMDKVGEDSALVPDPTPMWDKYHYVNKQLAGVILNFGVRRVINTLTVLGKSGKGS